MKKKTISMGMGIMSLLMIFIILCMVILAVLSYQNAQQSEALALRERETLTTYYTAQQKASLLYANIQEEKGKSIEAIYETLLTSTKAQDGVTISLENDILNIAIFMDEVNAFHVQVDAQQNILQWGQGKDQNIHEYE